MTGHMQRIIESKRARRKELAALPVGEKLRMLEQMIEATRAIAASHPPQARQSRSPRSRLISPNICSADGILAKATKDGELTDFQQVTIDPKLYATPAA